MVRKLTMTGRKESTSGFNPIPRCSLQGDILGVMHDNDLADGSTPSGSHPFLTPASGLYDAVREALGSPASLQRLLDLPSYPRPILETPPRVIASGSVVPWHEWGSEPGQLRGELQGWADRAGSYGSQYQVREELARFGSCQVVEDWACDIQQVEGVSASKSDLRRFTSLDEMVETNAREMIAPLTIEKLRENLAHGEIRILQENSSDSFVRYRWDGRVFLVNSGGSHHFAAARYIAKRLGVPVPLRGKLRTYSLSAAAIVRLQRDFEMFVVSGKDVHCLAFGDAMRRFEASYFWKSLPQPYRDRCAVLLPKSERRAMRVARSMREAGCFDLAGYLRNLTGAAPTWKHAEDDR